MESKEFGEIISLPEGYEGHIVINHPSYKQIDTCRHQGEPVFVTTDDGQYYFFGVFSVESDEKDHRLYSGLYMHTNPDHIFTDVTGDSFLLILNEGTSLQETEIWTKEI